MIFAFKIGFLDVRLIDLIDILLVAFLLYQVYKLLKGKKNVEDDACIKLDEDAASDVEEGGTVISAETSIPE